MPHESSLRRLFTRHVKRSLLVFAAACLLFELGLFFAGQYLLVDTQPDQPDQIVVASELGQNEATDYVIHVADRAHEPISLSDSSSFRVLNRGTQPLSLFFTIEKSVGNYEVLVGSRYSDTELMPTDTLDLSWATFFGPRNYRVRLEAGSEKLIQIKKVNSSNLNAHVSFMGRSQFYIGKFEQGALIGALVLLLGMTLLLCITACRLTRSTTPLYLFPITLLTGISVILLAGGLCFSADQCPPYFQPLVLAIFCLVYADVSYSEVFAEVLSPTTVMGEHQFLMQASRLWGISFLPIYLWSPQLAAHWGLAGLLCGNAVRTQQVLAQRQISVWSTRLWIAEGISLFTVVATSLYFNLGIFKQVLLISAVVMLLFRVLNLRIMMLESNQRHLLSTRAKIELEAERVTQAARLWAIELSAMSRGISHDLNQPASSLKFLIKLLKKQIPADAHYANKLDQLEQAQAAQEELINDLTNSIHNYARETLNSTEQTINLYDVLYPLIFEYRARAFKKGISIRFVSTNLRITTDPSKLRRIVRNAIDNAFKHCQEGKILVGVRRSREMVSIQVWDTGPGLDTYNKNASTSGSHIGNTVMFDLAQSIGASTEMNTVFYTRGIYRTGAFFELNLPVHRAKSVNASLVPKGVYNNGAKSFRQGYIVDTSPDGLCDELMVKLQQFGDNTCVLRLKTIIKNIDKRIYPSYVVVMVRDAANDVFLTDKVLASETQTFVPVIYVLAKSGLSMKIPSRPGIAVVPYAFAYPENILRTVASTASLLGKLDSTELDSKVPDDMASSSNPRRREPQIG